MNAFSAETAAQLPPDAIRNVLRSTKKAGPTLSRTKEICDALGLEITIAPKHEVGSPVSARVNRSGDEPPSGFLTIPWLDPRPGMGSAPVAFARLWLEENELIVDFLQAVIPDVIEVEASASENAVAVIDSRVGLRKGHALWCFREMGRVTIAHVTFRNTLTIIHPARVEDAPRVLDSPLPPSVTLLGKVVWMGQSVPLRGKVG